MKRLLLFSLLCLLGGLLYGQDPTIDKGSGWLYFSGTPGTTPNTSCCSEVAIDVTTRKAYIWNRSTGAWIPWMTLNTLSDVNTTGITSGKILKWNGSQWVMADDETGGGGGGSVTVSVIAAVGDTTTITTPTEGDLALVGVSPSFTSLMIRDSDRWREFQGGSGLSDGDKGDITVSGSGSTFTIDASAVTSGKIAANAIDSTKIVNGGISGQDIAQMGAGPEQVLKYDGTRYKPGIANVRNSNVYIADSGMDSLVFLNPPGDASDTYVFAGKRAYPTGEVALRGLSTIANNAIIFGRGVGIGSDLSNTSLISAYEGGSFARTTGSHLAGYVAGRNSSLTNSFGGGYKAGINAHGSINFYGGFTAGRNIVGSGNTVISSYGVGPVVATYNFTSSAVDTANQRIYWPAHGLPDSVFTATCSTTGTKFYTEGIQESDVLKFSVVNADSIQLWNWPYRRHYYLVSKPLLKTAGTHTIQVHGKLDNIVVVSGSSNPIFPSASNQVVLGTTTTTKLRVGQGMWVNVPDIVTGSFQSTWRWRTFGARESDETFVFNPDTLAANVLLAENVASATFPNQLVVRSRDTNKSGAVAIYGSPTPTTFSAAARLVQSQTGSFDITNGGGTFNMSSAGVGAYTAPSAGSGSYPDGFFTFTANSGSDVRAVRIRRDGTNTSVFAGLWLEQNTTRAKIEFNDNAGTMRFLNEKNNTGNYTFSTTTSSSSVERLRIDNAGDVGIGVADPTAYLHIKAGTATAGTAPLKFTSGTNLTTPEAGVVEYDGTNFHATNSTATRFTLAKTLTATAALDFGGTPIAVNSYEDLTITVTGAASGDAVSIGVPAGSMLANISFFAWVSAGDTVTVRCLNNDASSTADPASGTFRAVVTKY